MKNLTRDEALRLHRKMWDDMKKKLGDNPTHNDRSKFKAKWVRTNGFKDLVSNTYDCFLCKYTSQRRQEEDAENRETCLCHYCPIDWNYKEQEATDFCPCERGEITWLYSPISTILGLPERGEEE